MVSQVFRCLKTLTLTALIALTWVAGAAQVVTTGSRTGHHVGGRIVVSLDDPSEIKHVQELLEAGRNEEAVALAEDYLESLDGAVFAGGASVMQQRYLALTAYCAALTGVGRLDDAVEACTGAIELNSGRWTALNNRGTAYLGLGDYDAALADYERAREVAPRSGGAKTAIEHNIRLAERRRDGSLD